MGLKPVELRADAGRRKNAERVVVAYDYDVVAAPCECHGVLACDLGLRVYWEELGIPYPHI